MKYEGKKVSFYTLGCKLNYSETSTITKSFEKEGFETTRFNEKADVYVINTCSVTNQGDKSSRNIIRQAIKQNPDALIMVVGCYAQLRPDEIKEMEGVDIILGNNEKFQASSYIDNLSKKEKPEVHISKTSGLNQFYRSFSWGERTRSFLKIQDGCDYYCSFCTIPIARGRSRNNSIKNTLEEARKIIKKGYKEIILTGVNIGDFGKSTNENFYNLLQELEKLEGLKRLRISSVEPNLLKDRIIELAAGSSVIMPHFHIPLQSGSEKILTLMKRKYTTSLFESRINKIKEVIPNAFIGVDIIAGMNGETEKHFQESYDFINHLDISKLHVFPYSERSGTQALKIPWKISNEEKKTRVQKYINLSEKKHRAFYEKNIGSTRNVLFEAQKNKQQIFGFTDNYIKIETVYNDHLVNQICKVKLESILPNGNMKVALIN